MTTAILSPVDKVVVAPAHLLDRVLAQLDGPDRVACISAQGTLSYPELCTRIEAYAAGLAARAVGPGSIVAFDAIRSADAIALILAILHRGAAYLPLDPAMSAERRRQMLDDAKPDLVVAVIEGLAAANAALAPQMGELAYILFTSGSTGRPKGVAMRSAAVTALIDWHVAHPRLGRPARTLQFAPLSFDVSFQEILATLATGGSLILPTEMQRRDPWALLDLIESEHIERLFLPYVALQSLAEAVATDARSAPATLVDVITAGEQLRITPAIRAVFAALPGCVLHNHYGPTEAHVVTAHELAGDSALWPELPPIGKPLPHVRVRIVDAEGARAAVGEGELLLGGACLAQGYINRPDLTAERFVDLAGERWYRTGDRVRQNMHGALDYLGRLDDQIKLAGYRVEPGEIEAALCLHARVAEAVVVAVGDASDKRLVAHIVPRDIHAQDAALVAALREHCQSSLAPYLVPQEFIVHALLPLTASGKIDRRVLARADADVAIAWDENAPLEVQIASLWQHLLDLPKLDMTANLFDSGARSLTVVHALTELRRRGHVLSVAQIYEHPTIAAQVVLLSAPQNIGLASVDAGRGERQRAALARFARPGGGR